MGNSEIFAFSPQSRDYGLIGRIACYMDLTKMSSTEILKLWGCLELRDRFVWVFLACSFLG